MLMGCCTGRSQSVYSLIIVANISFKWKLYVLRTYVRSIFARRSASMPYWMSSELNEKNASARVTPTIKSYLSDIDVIIIPEGGSISKNERKRKTKKKCEIIEKWMHKENEMCYRVEEMCQIGWFAIIHSSSLSPAPGYRSIVSALWGQRTQQETISFVGYAICRMWCVSLLGAECDDDDGDDDDVLDFAVFAWIRANDKQKHTWEFEYMRMCVG